MLLPFWPAEGVVGVSFGGCGDEDEFYVAIVVASYREGGVSGTELCALCARRETYSVGAAPFPPSYLDPPATDNASLRFASRLSSDRRWIPRTRTTLCLCSRADSWRPLTDFIMHTPNTNRLAAGFYLHALSPEVRWQAARKPGKRRWWLCGRRGEHASAPHSRLPIASLVRKPSHRMSQHMNCRPSPVHKVGDKTVVGVDKLRV